MKYLSTLTMVLLLSTHFNVNAAEQKQTSDTINNNAGFGLGAIIGGLLAGPPGIVIGAASGTWLGVREKEHEKQIADLEKRFNAQSIELAYQKNESTNTKASFEKELQNVVNHNKTQSLEKLSKGISYIIYYKTNDADIPEDIRSKILQLANLIKPYPEIKIQIAGYTDHRGSNDFNLALSKKRISKVQTEFIKAGISGQRLQLQAYGEKETTANTGDYEAYIFDRKVTINLTLNKEA